MSSPYELPIAQPLEVALFFIFYFFAPWRPLAPRGKLMGKIGQLTESSSVTLLLLLLLLLLFHYRAHQRTYV
jgi:hypothetical protein